MNIVDCLAIAPYYLTLFFFPDPEIRVSQEDDLYSTVTPANSEEEEESGFGDVGRIMQVRIRHNQRNMQLLLASVHLIESSHRFTLSDTSGLFLCKIDAMPSASITVGQKHHFCLWCGKMYVRPEMFHFSEINIFGYFLGFWRSEWNFETSFTVYLTILNAHQAKRRWIFRISYFNRIQPINC